MRNLRVSEGGTHVSTESENRQLQAESYADHKGRQPDNILRKVQRGDGLLLLPLRCLHVHARLYLTQLHEYSERNVPQGTRERPALDRVQKARCGIIPNGFLQPLQ